MLVSVCFALYVADNELKTFRRPNKLICLFVIQEKVFPMP